MSWKTLNILVGIQINMHILRDNVETQTHEVDAAMNGLPKSAGSTNTNLIRAIETVQALGTGNDLRKHISDLEQTLAGKTREEATALVAADGITSEALLAALVIKAMAGQINVIVHALGILLSLPYLLEEGETIEGLSLGAGNTGRNHDLETDKRVAEFKFITWRGGADTIRQNGLFVDLFNLASSDTTKRRELYVLGKREPDRFLNGRRAIPSVLTKHATVKERFDLRHAANGYRTVRQYWDSVRDQVEIIDLRERVPMFGAQAIALLDEAESGT